MEHQKEQKRELRFRRAAESDLEALWEIETICFPPYEVVERENLVRRLAVCPDEFLLAEDAAEQSICGYIGGICAEKPELTDEMFSGHVRHEPEGKHLMILGLEVRPEYRSKGLAGDLMRRWLEDARRRELETCVLTCHEYLVPYYQRFGFQLQGLSDSVWGGTEWYDMICPL